MPFWMMQNLVIEEGGLVKVKNVSLKKATFVKFKPLSVDFLEISNPKAVLETKLRKFTCLTVGDQICIQHSDKSYYLEIRDVQPNGAASIIETDCNVDFEEPVGYKETFEKKSNANGVGVNGTNGAVAPTPLPRTLQKAKADSDIGNVFKPFSGGGFRIDGREAKNSPAKAVEPEVPKPQPNAEIPTYQSKIGNQFAKKKNSVSAFTGAGHKLT
jgi:ubiquitin fusion degradation protein 1